MIAVMRIGPRSVMFGMFAENSYSLQCKCDLGNLQRQASVAPELDQQERRGPLSSPCNAALNGANEGPVSQWFGDEVLRWLLPGL
jgi:hypothetical protein